MEMDTNVSETRRVNGAMYHNHVGVEGIWNDSKQTFFINTLRGARQVSAEQFLDGHSSKPGFKCPKICPDFVIWACIHAVAIRGVIPTSKWYDTNWSNEQTGGNVCFLPSYPIAMVCCVTLSILGLLVLGKRLCVLNITIRQD